MIIQSLHRSFEMTACLIKQLMGQMIQRLTQRPARLCSPAGHLFQRFHQINLLSYPIPEAVPDESQQDQVQITLCMNEEQKLHEIADCTRVDNVKDRVYKHLLKNRKIKLLYQN